MGKKRQTARDAQFMLQSTFSSVETRRSWVVAVAALLIMAVAFGAPWITLVALKDIAAEVRGERSVPAFASALMWIGSGVGGILMGRIAERLGIRFTVIFGSLMVAVGLALSSFGPSLPLFSGHGLFMGLLGIGGINAPFYVYVSRWFDRRRGTALALISSGQYVAGMIWPSLLQHALIRIGWQRTMLGFAAVVILIIPLALMLLRRVARVLPEETVLLHGAAGGVGTVTGQLARHWGLRPLLGTALAAAKAEFAERGYAAATVIRIAERADMSVQTLYSNWGNKRNLLRAVMEASVTGDEDLPLVPGEPPAVFAGLPEREDAAGPGRLLAHLSHQYRLLAERAAIGWQTYRDAAATDPGIAADWQRMSQMRRQAFRVMFTRIPAAALRPGLTQEAAADPAWVIASPETHYQLVRQAGYSYDQLEDWVRGTLSAALLAGG